MIWQYLPISTVYECGDTIIRLRRFIANASGRPQVVVCARVWLPRLGYNSLSIELANAGEDETEPEVELVAKRKTITPVWKHFGFEADEEDKPQSPDRPICCVCQQGVAAKDGNTSNLYSHLKDRHPGLYLQVERGQAQARMIVQLVSYQYQRHGKGCRHFRPVLESTRDLSISINFCMWLTHIH